jgi:RimJ/RimL family protein N-acetyltransferase
VLPVTLTSDRVRLDVPTRLDIAAITAACQDPEVTRWTTVPTPYTEQDARGFVDALVGPGWASGSEMTWAIRSTTSTWLEGVISLRTARRELGFWLAPSGRGRGLMTEAVRLVTDYAFAHGYPDVYWECYLGNRGSAGVARRAGFSYMGTATGRIPARDGSPALVWHGLLRADGSPASDLPWPPDSYRSPQVAGDEDPRNSSDTGAR